MLGDRLWGEYGFVDAFSETHDWYASWHLAIDQGPIVVMIENWRTGLLWNLFMSCPEIHNGLRRLGFESPRPAAADELADGLEQTMSAAPWWQTAVIYEIYPRSFQDSDGDGVGDLAGILQRVDYLAWLGVDAVWICPIYPSPMADFGYDVADYTGIDPLFGTMADFERLVAALHARGIRLILDFVPNHSSDQHPWFQEARAARASPRRDWYIWRDPGPDGGPPNNWVSQAGGGAWEFDPRDRAVLLPRLPQGAARPQLAQSRGPARRCTTRCVSGWTRASTASGSTCCGT